MDGRDIREFPVDAWRRLSGLVLQDIFLFPGSVADNRTALLNFDGISYAKGASVLRQLVAFVGQDAFFAGLRTYLAKHAFANEKSPAYDAPSAKASWERMMTFLGKHL